MKNLIVIRHAKSSWETFAIDKERPLNSRGIQDAGLVAAAILKFLPEKFVVWSSTAKRAAATAQIFTQKIDFPLDEIVWKDELYTFDSKKLEKIIKSAHNSYDCVILFGHNEAITDFVNKFGNVFIENVVTSGVVSIVFDTDSWENIRKGVTQNIVFPKDLK